MTQNEAIRLYLESGNTLTHRQADRMFGCARLGARVYEINQEYLDQGEPRRIQSEKIPVVGRMGKRKWVARYWVEDLF